MLVIQFSGLKARLPLTHLKNGRTEVEEVQDVPDLWPPIMTAALPETELQDVRKLTLIEILQPQMEPHIAASTMMSERPQPP